MNLLKWLKGLFKKTKSRPVVVSRKMERPLSVSQLFPDYHGPYGQSLEPLTAKDYQTVVDRIYPGRNFRVSLEPNVAPAGLVSNNIHQIKDEYSICILTPAGHVVLVTQPVDFLSEFERGLYILMPERYDLE